MPPLVFYVFLDRLDCCAASRKQAISPSPKYRLPVEQPEVLSEFFAGESTGHSFQVVDEDTELHARMAGYEQMDMILLAAKLKQSAIPFLTKLLASVLEEGQDFRGEAPASVFAY